MNFNYRNSYYSYRKNPNGKKMFGFEISGFNSNPSIYLEFKENKICFHIGLFIGLWLSFYTNTHRKYDNERRISISWHDASLWWQFWTPIDSWSSKTPKWQHGNFDFRSLIQGKHNCRYETLDKQKFLCPMIEGNYEIEIEQKMRYDEYKRWPTSKMLYYEVKAGYYGADNKFIEVGIPLEGKGENSWDCGEDATFGSSFGNTKERQVRTIEEAYCYFVSHMLSSRIRYGGNNWVPKAYHGKELKIIQKL